MKFEVEMPDNTFDEVCVKVDGEHETGFDHSIIQRFTVKGDPSTYYEITIKKGNRYDYLRSMWCEEK